ncbi:hypothetical protein HK101_001162 [Irineochytrium annulatum]|nr:hypothetical protein HK101_001162 [Irineochytrium annulatum]
MHLIRSLAVLVAAAAPSLGQTFQSHIRRTIMKAIVEELASPEFAAPASNLQSHSYSQTIDHFGSVPGKFAHRYWTNDVFYKPGGPILYFIQGESEGEPAFIDSAGINIWHLGRNYSGLDSMPVSDLSTENLKLLTSRQAIMDGIEFLTWFKNQGIETGLFPDCTKILAFGGSYPGSLAAWYRAYHPEVIFAAQASSAPVVAQLDFHQYSEAALGVYALDQAIASDPVKTAHDFGLSPLNVTADITGIVSSVLAGGVQYGPTYSPFGMMDASPIIDVLCNGKRYPEFANPNATQASMYTAMQGFWNDWLKANGYIANNANSVGSFSTYSLAGHKDLDDPVVYGKVSVPFRYKPFVLNHAHIHFPQLWYWQTCNEFGFMQVAEHIHKPVYSRYNNLEYARLGCSVVFGEDFAVPDTAATNAYWGGLNVSATNLIWVNGQIDPVTDTPPMKSVKSGINAAWAKIVAQDTCCGYQSLMIDET